MDKHLASKQCYNSWSCVLSVLIIAFLLGAVIYDMTYAKPKMQKSIKQIETQVEEINNKIDIIQTAHFIESPNSINSLSKKIK